MASIPSGVFLISCMVVCMSLTAANDKDRKNEEAKVQFFNLNPLAGTYNFGYVTNEHGHFHHENRGPDGITYGCYGYIQQSGRLQITHYVADARGYRVIAPNQPVQLFFKPPSVKNSDPDTFDDEYEEDNPSNAMDLRSEVRQWYSLFLPKGCYNYLANPAQTIPPPKPATSLPTPPPKPVPSKPIEFVLNGTISRPSSQPSTTARPVVTSPPSVTTRPPRPGSDGQSDLLSGVLGPVVGSVGGLLGGVVGGLLGGNGLNVGLNVGLGPYYYAPYGYGRAPANVPQIPCDDCDGDATGYLGLSPAVYVQKTLAERAGLVTAHQGDSKNIRNIVPMQWLVKNEDGTWQAQGGQH